MTKVEGGGVPVGTQLNGIYEIDERVGVGGMGEVYIGHNIQTGDKVAIKMILPEHAHNQVIIDLFRKEASTLNRLYHEAIVRYYVFSVDPDLDRPYLAMEYASGPSLSDRLGEGPLSSRDLDILRQRVASGLAAAHRLGVFHRDISPDNVILLNGEVAQAKIIDFGIAKSTTAEGTLIGGGFAGKLNYVSPEQLGLAGGEVTARSDIYSLGLVLAEAAIGQPLPMSGSQAEVLEKRRTVPDLAEVPEAVRPLVEWMLQPDPADRPSDMDAVANWRAQRDAAPAPRPDTRRARRGGAERDERKRGGFPWLLTGLVTATAAAAAVYFVIKGGEAPPPPPPDDVILSTGGQTAVATLSAPERVDSVAAPATVGTTYTWVSPPFQYSGDPTQLVIALEGTLPKGLEFEKGDDGTGVIYGIPEETGETRFRIVATGPEGQTASQSAVVSVKAAETALAAVEPQVSTQLPTLRPSDTSAASSGLAVPQTGGGAAAGGDVSALAGTGGGIAGPALTTSPVDSSAADPGAGATEPVVVGTAPSLQPFAAGDGGAKVAGGESAGAGVGTSSALATLPQPGQTGVTTPALTTSPVDSSQGDPAAGLPDMRPPDAPATLATPGTDNSVSGSGLALSGAGGTDGATAVQPAQPDQPFVIPQTGALATQPRVPDSEPAAPDTSVAAVQPQGQNLPPKIVDRIGGPIEANHGEALNLRLGAFDDEEGAGALMIRVDGRLPNGVQFLKAEGGVAQLYGQPAESGSFSFEVAAVDPQGLVATFPVTLNVTPPAAFRDMRDYIVGYDGGRCFLARPLELGERMAQIEVFAADVDPVLKFDGDFKIDRGFEANIGMRPIAPEQCDLINALDQVGPQALDNRLQFRIVKDQLRSGETLEGVIEGGPEARLFLYDNGGGVTDLGRYVTAAPGGARFRLPLHADGPQVLVAAIADPASGLGPTASLEQLLGAAQRGRAALALGFIMIEK